MEHQLIEGVGTKLPRVGAYIEPELKASLEQLAKKQKRSLSNFIAVVLQQAADEAKAAGELDTITSLPEPATKQKQAKRSSPTSPKGKADE